MDRMATRASQHILTVEQARSLYERSSASAPAAAAMKVAAAKAELATSSVKPACPPRKKPRVLCYA
jgi:hypothetical protein